MKRYKITWLKFRTDEPITYIISALLILACVSCKDTLTEKPGSYYMKDNFFVSNEKVELALRGVYDVLAKQAHYGQWEMAMPSSDDTYFITGTTSDNTRRDISHYTINSTNTWISDVWMYKYQGIDRANYLLAGAESMDGYKNGDTKLYSLMAEARFLRALLAFDLVCYFGDVPFKTTYSASYGAAVQPRSDREDIYVAIIEDLNFAKNNLAWATASSSPERVTQGAARALLMRVYLQRAGYSLQMNGQLKCPDDATRKSYFEAVIKEWEAFKSSGTYHDFYDGGYEALFSSFSAGVLNSKESLWEIAFYNSSGGVEDSGVWATWNGPLVDAPGIKSTETGNFMGRANAFFRVVPEWYDFFEDNDKRRDVVICTYKYAWNSSSYMHIKENTNNKNWFPGKWRREWMPIGYKDPNNTDVNYCYLRYADVVLMAAEAYNETDYTTQAWALLNRVRERSEATPVTSTNYASLMKAPKVHDISSFISDADEAGKFRTALYYERGFELAFEGQRKWDLIRWGILGDALKLFNEKCAIADNYPAGKNFVKGKHELFPVPLDEIQANPMLEGKNNPGY